MPAFSMARYRDPVFHLSVCPSIPPSIGQHLCQPNFHPNVQVHFPRPIKAKMMILGISLHVGITTQTAVSIFDLDLYFMVQQLCKSASILLPCSRNIARILVLEIFTSLKDLQTLIIYTTYFKKKRQQQKKPIFFFLLTITLQ